MSFPKMVFYDWAGANESLFHAINGAGGQLAGSFALVVSAFSQPKYFGAFVAMMAFCAVLDWTLRKIQRRGGADHALIAWFGAVCVFIVAHGVDAGVVGYAKHYFQMPRPYVVIAPEEMTLLEYHTDKGENYRSFPSGHVSFVSVLAIALWPVVSATLRKLLVVGVLLVAWARIATGVHFPADAVYAVLLALLLTVPIRWYLYALLLRFFHLKC